MEKTGFIAVIGCMKCGRCESVCNEGALTRIDGMAKIDPDKCMVCMRCVIHCPNKALMFLDI